MKSTNTAFNLSSFTPIFLGVGLIGVLACAYRSKALESATFATVATAGAVFCSTSGRNAEKQSELEQLLSTKTATIDKIEADKAQLEKQLQQSHHNLISFKQQLTSIQSTLYLTAQQLQSSQDAQSQAQLDQRILEADLEQMQQNYEAACKALEDYKLEVAEQIQHEVNLQAIEQVKTIRSQELQGIWNDCDRITEQMCQINERLTQWGRKAFDRNTQHQEVLKAVAKDVNQSIEENISAFDRQRDSLIAQIEHLQEQIARLQQEQAGKLLEPELIEAGFNPAYKAANEIALAIHRNTGIALRVYAVHESEGLYSVGFGISKRGDRHAIAQTIEQVAEPIARSLNIHEITSVSGSQILEGIKLSFRLLPEPPLSDDAVYRIMTKAAEFGATLRKYHNYKTEGKPTLRVMSATGGGKAIAVKNLIASYVNQEKGYEIWLSDPQDGSEEDNWQLPKLAHNKAESQRLFKEYVSEFDARANKESSHTKTKVLGIFDEFDKNHTEKDKDSAKRIWTAIRHQNMRLVLVGQSGEVGANGWTWDEMLNCTLLYIGDGIKTAIKHHKDLGFDLTIKRELDRRYRLISNWMKEKNATLDAAKKYRVGLLICGDHWEFLEVPPAITGEIENNKSMIVSHKWQSETHDSSSQFVESKPISVVPNCPTCGQKLQSRGEKWMCVNSNHLTGKGQKTWKKDKFPG